MARAACLLGIVLLFVAGGADWPQFRGPTGTGFVAGTPPIKWTDSDGVKWKTALPGPGSSSPIILGDRAFVILGLAACGASDDAAQCIGSLLSRQRIGPDVHP